MGGRRGAGEVLQRIWGATRGDHDPGGEGRSNERIEDEHGLLRCGLPGRGNDEA